MGYLTVWTSTKIADFVTMEAIKNGGKVIESFERQGQALNYATSLNQSGGAGYYCVVVK